MATRLFLRELTPTNDPGETERSTALPSGAADFQDYGIAVKALRTTKGTSETSVIGSSLAHIDHDDEFFTSFSSEALAAQTINANTWTIAVDVGQGSQFANSTMDVCIYIFREPSTVVGFISNAHVGRGNEWPSSGGGRVVSLSGAPVTCQNGDYLVFEFWRHTATQSMDMAYTQTLFYDGGTDVTEGVDSGDAASFIETPQDLAFQGAAVARRRVGFGGGRAVTL